MCPNVHTYVVYCAAYINFIFIQFLQLHLLLCSAICVHYLSCTPLSLTHLCLLILIYCALILFPFLVNLILLHLQSSPSLSLPSHCHRGKEETDNAEEEFNPLYASLPAQRPSQPPEYKQAPSYPSGTSLVRTPMHVSDMDNRFASLPPDSSPYLPQSYSKEFYVRVSRMLN